MTRRGVFRLVAVVLSLTLTVLTIEVAARGYSWWTGRGFWSRPYAFESAFFVTYDWPAPAMEGETGLFKAGERVPRVKPSGELRVIAAGGSTTRNDHNPEGIRHTRLLETRLRPRLEPIEVRVLNAGTEAFSSAHTLVNFSLRLLDFDPDILIVQHNINDLSALDYGDELLSDYSNKYLSDSFLAFEHRTGVGGTLLQLSRALQLIRWQSTLLQNALEYSPRNGYLHSVDRGRQLFRRNLESIIAVGRQHGVRVILATQGHRDDEQGAFSAYNEETRRIASEQAVPLADAAKAMNGRRDLFLDPVHMSAKGVAALADVVEPVLEASLRDIIAAQNPGGDCAASAGSAIPAFADLAAC